MISRACGNPDIYTQTATVATLVGWQVNKVNSPVCPLSILHCRRKGCLFVCFVALRPKSTAMVMVGRSVHLTTLFPGQA